jgi:Flp pilus assembly protein TadB
MTTRTSAFRRIIYTDPDLRVSDAERSEVADRLGRHYSDGRLNQEEFNERVERAMSAKTQSDLAGLFDDLPSLEDNPEVPVRRARRRSHHTALVLALIVVLSVIVGHAFWWFFMPPWLAIMLFAAVGLYVLQNRERRLHRSEDQERRP